MHVLIAIPIALFIWTSGYFLTPENPANEPTLGGTVCYPQDGCTGTSTRPIAGDILLAADKRTYNPTALIAGTNVTISTSTYGRLTISAASGAEASFPFTITSYGVATSTIVGFTQGILATASSTFTSTFRLSSLTNGALAVFGGTVGSYASTTYSSGLTYSGGNVTADLGTSIAASEIADGDHGDFTYSGGSATIDANAVALGTDTTNNYVATIADAGNTTITVANSGTETAAVTLDVVDVNCTGCLGTTEIAGLGTADISGLDISDDTNLAATLPIILTGDTLSLANIYPFQGTGNSTSTLTRFLGGASTTDLTANTLKVGGTATTSISVAGAVTIPSGLTVSDLTSAIVLTGAGGVFAEYTGATCTNQFVRSLDALGAATCATVGAADVSLANLTATDASLTFSGTYNGSTARTIGVNLGHAFVWTSTHDFGGATSIEMVNGASPTVDAVGEFALDTTENELLIATSTAAGAPAVIKPYEWKGFAHASSSHGSGTTTKAFFIAPPSGAGYFESITCHTNSFLRVLLKDEAGNRMNDLVASSTEGNVKLFQNKDFTAGEVILVDIGTTTAPSSNVYLSCWTKIFWTRN